MRWLSCKKWESMLIAGRSKPWELMMLSCTISAITYEPHSLCAATQPTVKSHGTGKYKKEKEEKKRWICPCLPILLEELHGVCCPFWPKRFMAFWPPPDVLPAEMAHGTKWGNLQERSVHETRKSFFVEGAKVPVAGMAQRGLTLRESVASDMILSQPLKVAT